MEVQNEQNCHLILSVNVQRKQKDEIQPDRKYWVQYTV